MSGRAGELQWEWVWELAASPEDVWPLVSDTNRFNRDTGLPVVEDMRRGEELENARRRLKIVVKGVPVEWEELPFEWVRPYRFGVVRRYSKGPLREMRVRAELRPLGENRSKLTYAVTAVPRGILGHIAARLQIGILSRRAFGKIFQEYGEYVARTGQSTPPPKMAVPGESVVRQMDRLVEAGADPGVTHRLMGYLGTADDLSIVRIRPYSLARIWDLSRTAVLDTCLIATRLGVLDMKWDLLCPMCRGADRLQDLRSSKSIHCDTCRIDFAVDFDRSVELSFTPNPQIRVAPDEAFCVAGPQITPHILVQQLLAANEVREVRPRLRDGSYRVRTLSGRAASALRIDSEQRSAGEDPLRFELTPQGWQVSGDPAAGPDDAIELSNGTDSEQLFIIEDTGWADEAVTAAEVAANQKFRDLFTSEVLAAGEFVSVGTHTVLFTDLEGSTQLYRRIGDASAFSQVMAHFDVVRKAVAEEDGTVVKTIGDAVMAVFPTPDRAVRAVLAVRHALEEAVLEEGGELSTALRIKAGIHEGPSIAVTFNEQLDYFGTTVNIAARLGGLSTGSDLVISDRVRRHPGVEQLLGEYGAMVTPFDTVLRGMDEQSRGWRIQIRLPR